jgi:anion-transporting  ArsA/GET3 family ATPase
VEPASFFAASRLVIVAGKGGVGKTVVSAAFARAAAEHGLTTLLVEVDGKAATHRHFGAAPLGYAASELLAPSPPGSGAGSVTGRSVTPDDALVDWLEDHGMRTVARHLARSGALEVVATATPGIKDILVLGKVKQLANRGDADLIVLDAPAAGHAVGFLRAAATLADTARSGAIQQQAIDVLEMLRDPARCQVVLVTIPEETPVNELIETAFALEEDVGVQLAPIVVNGVYDELTGLDAPAVARDAARRRALDDAARLRLARQELQAEHVARLRRELPLEQLRLPFLFTPDLGVAESRTLAARLADGITALPDHVHPAR